MCIVCNLPRYMGRAPNYYFRECGNLVVSHNSNSCRHPKEHLFMQVMGHLHLSNWRPLMGKVLNVLCPESGRREEIHNSSSCRLPMEHFLIQVYLRGLHNYLPYHEVITFDSLSYHHHNLSFVQVYLRDFHSDHLLSVAI